LNGSCDRLRYSKRREIDHYWNNFTKNEAVKRIWRMVACDLNLVYGVNSAFEVGAWMSDPIKRSTHVDAFMKMKKKFDIATLESLEMACGRAIR